MRHDKIHFTPIHVSNKSIRQAYLKLKQLEQGGRKIEIRDEIIMRDLQLMRMLTVDHLHRLHFPGCRVETARTRLKKLIKYELLAHARKPEHDLKIWGLTAGGIYTLNLAGLLYQDVEEFPKGMVTWHTIPGLVLRDVLMSEVFVRVVEATQARGEDWSYTWVTPEANPDPALLLSPATAIIIRRRAEIVFTAFVHIYLGEPVRGLSLSEEKDSTSELKPEPLFAEPGLVIESASWKQVVGKHNRLRQRGKWRKQPELAGWEDFPPVLIIVRNEAIIEMVRDLIERLRDQRIVYFLTSWSRLMATKDILTVAVQPISKNPSNWRPLTDLTPAVILPVEKRKKREDRGRSWLLRAGRLSGAIPEVASKANLKTPEENLRRLQQKRRRRSV